MAIDSNLSDPEVLIMPALLPSVIAFGTGFDAWLSVLGFEADWLAGWQQSLKVWSWGARPSIQH